MVFDSLYHITSMKRTGTMASNAQFTVTCSTDIDAQVDSNGVCQILIGKDDLDDGTIHDAPRVL